MPCDQSHSAPIVGAHSRSPSTGDRRITGPPIRNNDPPALCASAPSAAITSRPVGSTNQCAARSMVSGDRPGEQQAAALAAAGEQFGHPVPHAYRSTGSQHCVLTSPGPRGPSTPRRRLHHGRQGRDTHSVLPHVAPSTAETYGGRHAVWDCRTLWQASMRGSASMVAVCQRQRCQLSRNSTAVTRPDERCRPRSDRSGLDR